MFETLSGRSMCPAELNTSPREGVRLEIGGAGFKKLVRTSYTESYSFPLTIINTSPTNEHQPYELAIDWETAQFNSESQTGGVPSVLLNGVGWLSPFVTPALTPGKPITFVVTVARPVLVETGRDEIMGLTFIARSACGSYVADTRSGDVRDWTFDNEIGDIADTAVLDLTFLQPNSSAGRASDPNIDSQSGSPNTPSTAILVVMALVGLVCGFLLQGLLQRRRVLLYNRVRVDNDDDHSASVVVDVSAPKTIFSDV